MTVFTFHLLGNAEALFNGFDAGGHQGLWETNGTAAGTFELTGINGASPSGINPTNFAVVRGASLFSLPEVLFSGTDASGHVGLWTTDGTSGGTSEITGIAGAGLSGISPSFNLDRSDQRRQLCRLAPGRRLQQIIQRAHHGGAAGIDLSRARLMSARGAQRLSRRLIRALNPRALTELS